jgi:hypothetical protein
VPNKKIGIRTKRKWIIMVIFLLNRLKFWKI